MAKLRRWCLFAKASSRIHASLLCTVMSTQHVVGSARTLWTHKQEDKSVQYVKLRYRILYGVVPHSKPICEHQQHILKGSTAVDAGELETQSRQMDTFIEQLNAELQAQQSDTGFHQRAFVTDEDIRNIHSFKVVNLSRPRD